MKGFWNSLSLIHGGNFLCTQRCDQCGILVDDYRALKQASTWEQHFTILSGHFIPTSDNFALNGGLVLGIHRESSRLGSIGSFFAPGTNTRIACYHASLHLLNMLPLSLLPLVWVSLFAVSVCLQLVSNPPALKLGLVGLMCRHGPPSSCLPPHIWGGVEWLHIHFLDSIVTCFDLGLSSCWCFWVDVDRITPPWGLSVVRWLMRGKFWSSPWHWRQRLESWVLSR